MFKVAVCVCTVSAGLVIEPKLAVTCAVPLSIAVPTLPAKLMMLAFPVFVSKDAWYERSCVFPFASKPVATNASEVSTTRGGGGFASGFGFNRGPKPKGANVAYRLQVPFVDAAALKPQRITLADGATIDLKLPAGVESGTQMRLAGKGQAGPGGNGDAIVTIEIQPHRFFTRDGDDVRLDLPITLGEAVLGGKVRAPTVDGAVNLTIAKGSTSGKVLRLKGKGFHKKGGGRGDQLVTLMIDVPANDAALAQFVANWPGGDHNPRGKLGV